jgi:hypothetical protein
MRYVSSPQANQMTQLVSDGNSSPVPEAVSDDLHRLVKRTGKVLGNVGSVILELLVVYFKQLLGHSGRMDAAVQGMVSASFRLREQLMVWG